MGCGFAHTRFHRRDPVDKQVKVWRHCWSDDTATANAYGAALRKLINDPRSVVREMLEGHVLLHAGQVLLDGESVVLRADLPSPAARQVAIISGGGSGHEPAHAGYVGTGMLHA